MKTNFVHQSIMALTVTLGFALFAPTSAAAVGVGKTCGGLPGIPCDAGLWCDLQAGRCGVTDVQGKCIQVPTVCPKGIYYVCGCGKKRFGNDCERQRAKGQLDHIGDCK
jgi:hypothetical protein